MNYSYTNSSDNNQRRGFIDKEEILTYVTQEEIFSLVFGYLPTEYEPVTSIFRNDNTPNCWFEYSENDVLIFKDFGNATRIRGIKMSHLDCFNAVMLYYNIANFYLTLEFIFNKLILGNKREPLLKREINPLEKEKKKPFQLIVYYRNFDLRDKFFWEPYGISSQNLQEDEVYAVSHYVALNTKNGDHVFYLNKEIAYAYTKFQNNKKKIYFPYRKKDEKRFITNCTENDIGGLESLPFTGRQLIITKAYKDYRVLRNEGKNVVWFSSETQRPNNKILYNLCSRFSEVICWFDNDSTGIEFSKSVSSFINEKYVGRAKSFWLPESYLHLGIKDPSDFRKAKSTEFKTYINTFL